MHLRSISFRSKFRSINTAAAGLLFVALTLISTTCGNLSTSPESGLPTYVSIAAGENGEFGEPFGIAVRNGIVFVSDGDLDRIWRLGPGGPEIYADGFDTPSGITFDRNGNLIVADTGSHTIKSVDPAGKVSIIAGVSGQTGTGDGDAAAATFHGPMGVAVDSDGRIFVADSYNDRIRVIHNGTVSTIAGSIRGFSEGIGGAAMFDTPTGLAASGERLLVADTGNGRIRVVEKDGTVLTLAGAESGDIRNGLLSNALLYRPTAIVTNEGSVFFTDGNAVRHIGLGPFPMVRTISSERRGFQDGVIERSMFNRPSGLGLDEDGALFIADSDNGLIRGLSRHENGKTLTRQQLRTLWSDPEKFKNAGTPRWPYDPPDAPRDIAGTLGEIRGEIGAPDDEAWFHNGLDIAGAYGETARFIRDEKVLQPIAAENFGTLRELLRMPTLGYIHIRLGRDQASTPLGDPRFLFERDPGGKIRDVRVPRGSKFKAGEPIGTLNAMNHVHLVAGRSGFEMNALGALDWPGHVDRRPPTIEKIILMDENWREFETEIDNSRIKLTRKARVVVRAYDQMDGNPERRRLGIYRAGWGLRNHSPAVHAVMGEWKFDRLPPAETVSMFYAPGSRSGAQGITVFDYIVSNSFNGESATEEFLDPKSLENGTYTLSVQVADYSGNISTKEVTFEVN